MLKILKYELIQGWRSYALTFGIFLAACVAIAVLPINIAAIAGTVLMLAVFGIAIAIAVGIVQNYWNSMFKRNAYLTLTLPVNSHQLIWGKVLATLIFIFCGVLVLAVGMLVLSIRMWGFNTQLTFGVFTELFGGTDWGSFFADLGITVVMMISGLISLYALLTSVQTKLTRRHKIVWIFVIMAVYWIIMSLIRSAAAGTAVSMVLGGEATEQSMLIWSLIRGTLLYLLTIYILDHQLEVE
ncbi:MAG: hypothetical protein LKF79_05495 [Solobacterium sp.]|jgi:hypothetical protein|nr:hypothetical protein [Solobacterium sp.]MCH4223210.1 hypothetical protein [Solobacterium sp.]MCH4266078.1 hypothetical protein [Solobacterium sp.]